MTDGFTTKTTVVFSFILNLSDFFAVIVFSSFFHQWSIRVLKVCKTESEHCEDNRKWAGSQCLPQLPPFPPKLSWRACATDLGSPATNWWDWNCPSLLRSPSMGVPSSLGAPALFRSWGQGHQVDPTPTGLGSREARLENWGGKRVISTLRWWWHKSCWVSGSPWCGDLVCRLAWGWTQAHRPVGPVL